MATTKFEVSKKAKSGKCEVKVRFSYKRGSVFRLNTGIWVPVGSWNDKKGKLVIPRLHTKEQVELSVLQSQIDELSNYLVSASIEADGSESSDYWKQKIDAFHGKGESVEQTVEETVDVAFELFITTRANNDMRRRQMLVVKRILLRFGLYINKELKFEDWDENYLCKLEDFLKIEHTFFDSKGKCVKKWKRLYDAVPETRKPQERGGNAIYSIMKRLRTFFNWCVTTGRMSVNPFKKHPLKECVYGTPYYLTPEEMTKLYNYKFNTRPALAVQRDIFVLQSNLGMRVGDFYSLTTSNIVRDAIEYIPSKTLNESGKVARIPLTKRAKEIIERYHKDGQMSLVPLISEQHYNKAIKDMLRIAGIDRVVTVLNPTSRMEEKHPIWEVASSHMARRNFIGNLYAEVKDPDLISSMTGHVEGSKAFARYRTIDDSIKQSVLSALG